MPVRTAAQRHLTLPTASSVAVATNVQRACVRMPFLRTLHHPACHALRKQPTQARHLASTCSRFFMPSMPSCMSVSRSAYRSCNAMAPRQILLSPASVRMFSSEGAKAGAKESVSERNSRYLIYIASVVVGTVGFSYAAVPAYKIFCQATGFGGEVKRVKDANAEDVLSKLKPVEGSRQIRITFNADTSDTMPWKFKPLQREVRVVPGETALAFFKASNPTDKTITGVSTYNVIPLKAGVYFNKIQCFCFEEQRLKAKEDVNMPVFFFLDPEFLKDPHMKNVDHITLSYTFFKTNSTEDDEIDAEE